MVDDSKTLIFTPKEGVQMETALAALRRNGVQELVKLGEVGLIVGRAPVSHLEVLRALPEFRAVDTDQPVGIASNSND